MSEHVNVVPGKENHHCDVCGTTSKGISWYGNTSAIVCKKISCNEEMDRRWKEHSDEIDKRNKFEKEMSEY